MALLEHADVRRQIQKAINNVNTRPREDSNEVSAIDLKRSECKPPSSPGKAAISIGGI